MEGPWRGTRLVALLVCAACVTVASGCGDASGDDPVEAVTTSRPASTFAPLVRLHPDEIAFPIAADRFIERASVKWTGGLCVGRANVATGRIARSKTPGRVPSTDAARLGRGRPYRREALTQTCKPRGLVYRATDLTRPYDSGPRAAGLPRDEGFYLDLLSDSKDGDPPRGSERSLGEIAAYYAAEPSADGPRGGLRISYWMLYGSENVYGARGRELIEREGDWERVDVIASRRGPRRWMPIAIVLDAGGESSRRVAWSDIERSGTHPVVFSARESHESYPDEGRHPRRVRLASGLATAYDETATCDDCPAWRTWERLRPVRREPWYGFGGGWGLSFEEDARSGPLGPRPG
jgi:hypothetical protein